LQSEIVDFYPQFARARQSIFRGLPVRLRQVGCRKCLPQSGPFAPFPPFPLMPVADMSHLLGGLHSVSRNFC
jgi:hypothetical protein